MTAADRDDLRIAFPPELPVSARRDDIAAAIQGWSDTAALTMHPANVTLVRVMDDPTGNVHGIIQMEVLIEQDAA